MPDLTVHVVSNSIVSSQQDGYLGRVRPPIAGLACATAAMSFSPGSDIIAHPILLGQQGRLQRRSLFLALLRHDGGS